MSGAIAALAVWQIQREREKREAEAKRKGRVRRLLLGVMTMGIAMSGYCHRCGKLAEGEDVHVHIVDSEKGEFWIVHDECWKKQKELWAEYADAQKVQ